jgi:hypothetical protein
MVQKAQKEEGNDFREGMDENKDLSDSHVAWETI